MTNELKSRLSKIMTLGNKLAAQMDRSAAFRKSWDIVKAGAVTLPVKGVIQGNRQEALRRLSTYDPAQVRAWLAPEPGNPADPAALAVMVMVDGGRGAYRLGYVPRNETGTVKALGVKIASIRVVSGTWGYTNKTTFGARLALAL